VFVVDPLEAELMASLEKKPKSASDVSRAAVICFAHVGRQPVGWAYFQKSWQVAGHPY
jgi:hypothetical protein